MNIFVGNLSFEAAEDDIKKLFEGFGNVVSVVILKRKEKKAPKSRGFGFVDMPDEQQALAAIAGINGKEFMGRVINVEPARPKVETKEESKPKKKRESEKARPFWAAPCLIGWQVRPFWAAPCLIGWQVCPFWAAASGFI
jgi:RNA recognition motif-containing protein